MNRVVPWVAVTLFALAGWLVAADSSAPITFVNQQPGSGLDFLLHNHATPLKHHPETMLGGVVLLDFDNDGWLDIYCANGAPLETLTKNGVGDWNRLYRNLGNSKFQDVTEAAGVAGEGYAMGLATGDFDNDGFTDLFVAGVNRNQLFRNQGDGSFRDVTAEAGLEGFNARFGKPFSVGAGWFDYNNDGLLDLFVVNYVRWSAATQPACLSQGHRAYCPPDRFDGFPNQLFRNNGDGSFTDVSEASGIGKYIGKGMGIAFGDYNLDGFMDVFVSNDMHPGFLFHNNGDGTFEEMGLLLGVALNEHGRRVAGMGVDFRDIDNDELPDLFVTALFEDTFPLYRNRGDQFQDVTSSSNLAAFTTRLTGWSNGIVDFDNDGWKDLFTANSAVLDNSDLFDNLPYRLPVRVFRNLAGMKFEPIAFPASVARAAANRGAAFGDLNNDGRMDAVVTAIGEPVQMLINHSAPGNAWLIVRLRGRQSNRDGLGARLTVKAADGFTQHNAASTSVGYASSSDKRVHFGLGARTGPVSVEVVWPSGKRQVIPKVAVNQILEVREP